MQKAGHTESTQKSPKYAKIQTVLLCKGNRFPLQRVGQYRKEYESNQGKNQPPFNSASPVDRRTDLCVPVGDEDQPDLERGDRISPEPV